MKIFTFKDALIELKLNRTIVINKEINYKNMPSWIKGNDFLYLFLPYITIKIDSREKDKYIENACKYYGINFEIAKKDKKAHTENLKEGDITFKVTFDNKIYDYTNIAHYERKGSASEWYNNITKKREQLNREMQRQYDKGYKKFVLLLEIGDCLYDLINYKFHYYNENGMFVEKNLEFRAFSTIMSWCQNNHFGLELIQVDTQKGTYQEKFNARSKLFFMMLYDMFYFFRQELRIECIEKNLIENIKKE